MFLGLIMHDYQGNTICRSFQSLFEQQYANCMNVQRDSKVLATIRLLMAIRQPCGNRL